MRYSNCIRFLIMNLFILDQDPIKAAEYYQDLHVNKIIIEGAQMLANAYHKERLAEVDCPRTAKGTPRTWGFPAHPMAKWARENASNFEWTLKHIKALCKEYTFRQGKRHFTEDFVDWVENNKPQLKEDEPTVQPQCFVTFYPQCIVPGDPVQGYRNYYNTAKQSFDFKHGKVEATWTKRETPFFFRVTAV